MKRFAIIGAQGTLWFLATGLILSLPPPASAQVQEGVLSGTFAAFGTVKATAAGKERVVLAIDENGLSVTNGVLNDVTWHCSGLADYTNGLGQSQGFWRAMIRSETRSSSTGSQRSTRRSRRLCAERSPGQAVLENTRGSAAAERMWIIPENSGR